MTIKNLLITKHGSHLYGMATLMSDLDLYVVYDFHHKVYRPNRLIAQSIDDESDTTKIFVDKFVVQVIKGVPQALEALYAPPEAWLERHQDWQEVETRLKQYEVPRNLSDILETYKRTAINFMGRDDFKRNRHAFRLLINAKQLQYGTMNPVLSEEEIERVSTWAKLPYQFRLEKFKEELFKLF